MKKLLSILLASLMILCLAACGGSSSSESASDSESASGSESASLPAGDNVLTMATNAAFPPYEYYDGEVVVGIDAEIAALIAEKLGMTLEIVDIDFNSIVTSVQTGKYDMGMAGMTVTEERLENVSFSKPYATGVQVIIVKEGSAIASVDDLANAEMIGVQEATTGHIYCEGDYGADHVTAFTTGANAVQALLTDKVDCVVIDNEPAKAFVAANEGLKILDTEYVTENYAACFSKSNTELLEKFNQAMKELTDDGTIPAIIEKYISADSDADASSESPAA